MRMIPPYIKESTKSNAEKNIFNLFRKTDYDCVVLHSLGISDHRTKITGEIDFVLICREGILCLEVKGGQVWRSDGLWYFVNKHGKEFSKSEGPFDQVRDSMFSLRDYLAGRLGNRDALARCQYACGVMFPDQTFGQKGPDIIEETVFDNRYRDEEITEYIRKTFTYWRNRCLEKHGFEGQNLSKHDIMRAVNYLRGNFGAVPMLGTIISETDKQLVALTDEQYRYFEAIGENPRLVVKGGAGTGKTLLGIEHAKRMSTEGKKVLYLTYNRMIADYLRCTAGNCDPEGHTNIDIIHFHGIMANYIDTLNCGNISNDEYYGKILPERFYDYICGNGNFSRYDAVIIDEGQDLLRFSFLMCINEMISGGFDNGEWVIMYDPNQNIFNDGFTEGMEVINKCQHVTMTLTTNCRNTKQIGIYNTLLTNIMHAKYLKIDGEDVVLEKYSDSANLRKKLLKLVKNLRGQGVNTGDIVILSPYTFENSSLQGDNIFGTVCRFQDITDTRHGHMKEDALKFSTIQGFKGMEAKIVFIIDMEHFQHEQFRLLYYTAISRAKALLYMFYNENSEESMHRMIAEGSKMLSSNT